ncbi:MAG TPA: branched-chain amino acid ABC transporter substrate-binding protein [Pseudomonadales bacterium]|nr:branched-chain amino acid ABC transporter substrate-binding protein [Pseudomonadales bacterium]
MQNFLRAFKPWALACSVLLLAACNDNKESKTTATVGDTLVIKIAHAAPLTGPQAHLGKDNENGVRLAVDELNAQGFEIGGKKARIELLSEDDQADPRVATTVAQKFVDEKVQAVIGHMNSGTTIPASKIYFDAGIVQVSPSATNVKYTQQGFKTAFRLMANDAQQGKVLGNFAVQDLHARKIALIDDRTAYGQGLAAEFEKAVLAQGGEIIGHEFTSDRASDFTAILTKIKGLNADLLFYGGMDAQAAPMVKQMRTLGLTLPFMAGDGTHTAEFLTLAGAAADGVVASLPGVPLENMPGGPAFAEKFQAKYGKIQLYAPYSYDTVHVLIHAMQKAQSIDPATYVSQLATIHYAGVTAPIAFDDKGDLKGGSISVYRAEQGEWKLLKTLND